MAHVVKRTWRSGPRKVKRVAWGYTLMVNGRQERKSDRTWTEDEARAALVARQEALQAGPPPPPPAERSLGELADEYLTYKAQRGKRSLKEDRRILKKRLLPAFGADLPVRQLAAAMIGQYERTRAGQVSAYTVANELTVLRHMLRLGRRWGYLDQVPDIEMPKKPDGRLRYLDEGEIAKLLEVCTCSRNPYLSAVVALALNTGMRKAEILGLEWERVDLSADYGLSARITLYKTKSGKPRGVPLNEDAIAALESLKTEEHRSGAVFKRRDGTEWGQVRTAFETALKRAGIEGFRFHDLRHTFASHYMMRGGNLYDLKEILGHSDIAMTMRYAHLSPHHLRAGVQKLEGLARASAHGSAHNGKITAQRLVSPRAPVAQADRAAVS
jgi:integrase